MVTHAGISPTPDVTVRAARLSRSSRWTFPVARPENMRATPSAHSNHSGAAVGQPSARMVMRLAILGCRRKASTCSGVIWGTARTPPYVGEPRPSASVPPAVLPEGEAVDAGRRLKNRLAQLLDRRRVDAGGDGGQLVQVKTVDAGRGDAEHGAQRLLGRVPVGESLRDVRHRRLVPAVGVLKGALGVRIVRTPHAVVVVAVAHRGHRLGVAHEA